MEDKTEYPVLTIPKMCPDVETEIYATGCYHYEKVEIPLGNNSATTRCLIYSKLGNTNFLVGVEHEEDVAIWICENL